MPSGYKQGDAYRNIRANAGADAHDGGTPPARIEHRTGAAPAAAGDASTGTLLGTNLFSNPAFGNAAAGVVTANAIVSDTSADASGTLEYGRVYQGGAADTAALYQFSSGEAADTPDVEFDESGVVAGGVIAISSWVKTEPIT